MKSSNKKLCFKQERATDIAIWMWRFGRTWDAKCSGSACSLTSWDSPGDLSIDVRGGKQYDESTMLERCTAAAYFQLESCMKAVLRMMEGSAEGFSALSKGRNAWCPLCIYEKEVLHTSLLLVGMAAALFMLERAWLLHSSCWREHGCWPTFHAGEAKIDSEMDMDADGDRNRIENRKCPVKRPRPDTVQELRKWCKS